MSEPKQKLIAFRATSSIQQMITSLKDRFQLGNKATDSDVIRMAIESLDARQAVVNLMHNDRRALLSIGDCIEFGVYPREHEYEFLLNYAYQSLYLSPHVPKMRESYIAILESLKGIYKVMLDDELKALTYHKNTYLPDGENDLIHGISKVIEQDLPKDLMIHSGYEVYARPASNLEEQLKDISIGGAINFAGGLKTCDKLLLMAKRHVIQRAIINGEGLAPFNTNRDFDSLSDSVKGKYFELSAIVDSNDMASFMVFGFNDEISVGYNYLELESLWKCLWYAVNVRNGLYGSVFYGDYPHSFSCRIQPDNIKIFIHLNKDKALDLLSVLDQVMIDDQNMNSNMGKIIKNEREAFGFV